MNLATLAVAIVASIQPLRAAPVEITFAATVNSSIGAPGLPSAGAAIQGRMLFDYDSTAYVSQPCGTGCMNYSYASPYTFFVDLDASQVSSPVWDLSVLDDDTTLFGQPMDVVTLSAKVNAVSYVLYLIGPPASFTGIGIPDPAVLEDFWTQGVLRVTNQPISFQVLLSAAVSGTSVLVEPTNVALASAGAIASASSSYSTGYAVGAVNNNERAGANPGNGGYWNDATPNVLPDSVQIVFDGSKSVDRVVVYSLQDHYLNPVEPTDTQTFSLYGLTSFMVEGRNGVNWVPLATVSGNTLVKRSVSFAAYTTDSIRITITGTPDSWSRITEIEVWGVAASGPPATSTTLASAPNPASFGASVSFTATVAGNNPTGSVSFTENGNPICPAGTLSGSPRTASCSTSSLAVGVHSIVANYAGDPGNAASSSAPLAQTISAPAGSSNVALASAGAVASASSFSAGYPVAAVNNNERAGANPGNGGYWNDATPNVLPDSVQIVFNGSKTIDRVVVYSVQDNYLNPVEPTDTQTFSLYGLTAFTVEGRNGANWVTLATVSGNTLVKRTVSFAAYTTDSIRVTITGTPDLWSRITEIEAWGVAAGGPPATTTTLASGPNPASFGASVTFTATVTGNNPTGSVSFTEGGNPICAAGALGGSPRTASCSTSSLAVGMHSIVANYAGDPGNGASSSAPLAQTISAATGSSNVALASAGAVASASSFSAGYPVAAVNNNERAGTNPGNGGYWNDATPNVLPDSVQIVFNGSQTIDRVVVYSVQDNYLNPVEPTDGQTFSLYGLTSFTVEGRNGANWVLLATVSGNNLVKRRVSFAAYTTDSIRVSVTGSTDSWSRITEIEAWGVAASGPPATTTTLTSAPNPASFGASVTFTATVSGANPTGSVTFTEGGNPVCPAGTLGGSPRTASCSTSSLGIGTHSIVANYAGDAGNAASSSAPLTQVITANGLTLTLSGTVYADNGQPLAGVRFDASAGQFSCPNSDTTGHYFCTVPEGWSGTITPSLAGYEFTPSQRAYDNVMADDTQDYLGIPH